MRGERHTDEGDVLTDATDWMNSIYGSARNALVLVRPDGRTDGPTDGYIGSTLTPDWATAFTTAAQALTPG
ncbi:hypothetical protein F0344_01725 [Streptomyces finlayi]|uniref:Uncharacterized protein n=1 Tax=Streptomyces finlayi TaxID=67296 RepID=A0A7G7BDT7_9ACTN|nr:hypothetical protein [Streptomyces finlayi]QNE73502.1 hypothetical protein F0344_01725 [Streptomyces finlayi]